MSAYGAIVRSSTHTASGPLTSTFWHIGRVVAEESTATRPSVTVHHLTVSTARAFDGLIDYLGVVMAKEVDDGMTYPQESLPLDAFESYFFSGDVFLAIFSSAGVEGPEGSETNLTLEEARQQRTWEECVAGYYYVKPNYPGRSSHICNGGFVVPPIHRGKGSGSALAKSYVHYAPKLGYRASVFNLVYTNNAASVKLWEGLNFKKAGLIPQAGRLRRKDGNGEEYVDAWVFYRRFVEEEVESTTTPPKDQNGPTKDNKGPSNGMPEGSPRNQPLSNPNPPGTAPPTPNPTGGQQQQQQQRQQQRQNQQNQAMAQSPGMLMNPVGMGFPSASAPADNIFSTDFIQNVTNGLDEFDVGLFRGDRDLNFERDFEQWFSG